MGCSERKPAVATEAHEEVESSYCMLKAQWDA